MMPMPGQPPMPLPYRYDDYDDEYDSEYDSEEYGVENYDVLNDGPEQIRGDWVKDPISMGDPAMQEPVPQSWDEFD